jgi:hypothetical protein
MNGPSNPIRRIVAVALALLAAILQTNAPAGAATPLDRINYQGVLRSASGAPLSGEYDMIFRFFSAPSGGDEILVDDWSQGVGGPVQVSGGLFDVWLGAGFPTDGSGPGTYTSLAQVFRDYGAVYLEVKVGAEVLTPRTLILSAPAALNADHLDGKDSSAFLDVSATPQTKAGQLFCADGVYATSTSGGYGIESYGAIAGGFFKDADSSGFGWVGYGDRGAYAGGLEMGGYFKDSDSSGYAEIGSGDYGLKAYGNTMGGRFQDLDSSGFAYAAYGDQGLYASGNVDGVFGFSSSNSGYGVHGQSFGAGGFFEDRAGSGQATVGKDNRGLEAQGSEMGGYFKDTDNTSSAYLAYGNYGVYGLGTTAGGYFTDSDLLDSGYAYVGYGDFGIEGFGESAGGYFKDSNGAGYAYAGISDTGVVASGSIGVSASGTDRGGQFQQTGGTGNATIAWSDRGVQAVGNDAGAYFADLTSSSFGLVGYQTYKIYGNGAMSFVQNHPVRKDEVIVYTAPEGDETATYTRGTARLVNGEARVDLGETFAWVTNPDIGLTAYVTPRDKAVPLAVAALTTDTLAVRGPAGEDVVFDYMVYGLRIGFEETTVVQEKTQEARIPSMADHRQRFERRPDLRGHTALARFERMEAGEGRPPRDRRASAALRDAIEEFDPAVHGQPHTDREPQDASTLPAPPVFPAGPKAQGSPPADRMAAAPRSEPAAVPAPRALPAPEPPGNQPLLVSVGESVEAGDVLVADPDEPGVMRQSAGVSDRAVVGIVGGAPGTRFAVGVTQGTPGEAPLAVSGIVPCKVDASYGAIRVGDLLVTSPTPGRAMRLEAPAPGTILGKALEPQPSGLGTIRVLVTLR